MPKKIILKNPATVKTLSGYQFLTNIPQVGILHVYVTKFQRYKTNLHKIH